MTERSEAFHIGQWVRVTNFCGRAVEGPVVSTGNSLQLSMIKVQVRRGSPFHAGRSFWMKESNATPITNDHD